MDDASRYCELWVCNKAGSDDVLNALLDWYKRLSVPKLWILDGGSHFKNQILKEIATKSKVQHIMSLAYSPWIDGSIERLNRGILQVTRVMLLEDKTDVNDWPTFVPLVQTNFNHTLVSLVEEQGTFTGLPAHSLLNEMAQNNGLCTLDITARVVMSVQKLRSSLVLTHKALKICVRSRSLWRGLVKKTPNGLTSRTGEVTNSSTEPKCIRFCLTR